MPINNFSIGRDLSFVVISPYGSVLAINGVTDYTPKPMFTDLKHKGLDGNVRHAEIPDGWDITIKLDRQDPSVDNFFAQLEADYFAGVNIQGGTITETIQEKDGSISQFRYDQAVLKYDDAGSWKGDSFTPVSLTAFAARRIKVS